MVRVDKEKCIGCGTCVAICPEGFELKNGKSSIKNKKAKCLEDAASSCPVGAIII
ncbi:MAG: ferredoxin [Candidatus Aenigmatarchaeota archaeon]